jgi:hypothetical protein
MDLRITKKSYAQDPEWLMSAHKVHRPGGVTIDSTKVTAVDGKKIVKAGTPIGKNASTGKWEPYTAAVANTLLTGAEDDNNAILWTAVFGVPKVALVAPDAASQALSIAVDWGAKTVTVNLATDETKAVTSTAAEVVAAVAAHYEASQLVTATEEVGESTGAAAVVAKAATALADGSAANVVPTDLLFNTVDVTGGDAAGGSMIHGFVNEDRLPVPVDAVCKANMPQIGFLKY